MICFKRVVPLSLLGLLSLGSCKSRNYNSNVKSDGVMFQVVPIPSDIKCNATILKSTFKYQNTAFKLPQAWVSVNNRKEHQIFLNEYENEKFELTFGLLFSITDNADRFPVEADWPKMGCDHEKVLTYLNRGTSAEDRVTTIAPLQIKNIAVRVDGLPAQLIGTEKTTLLDYLGRDNYVSFKFEGRENFERLKSRLSSGLPIWLDMNFYARKGNGSFRVKVNTASVAKNLETQLKGSGSTPAVIGEGQLKVAMRSAVENSGVNIDIEEGEDSNSVLDGLVEKIVNDIISSNSSVIAAGPVSDEKKDDKKPETDSNSLVSDVIGKRKFDVKAVVAQLKKTVEKDFTYNRTGKISEQTITTSTIFRLGETKTTSIIELPAGKKGNRVTSSMTPQTELTLYPDSRRDESVRYVRNEHYLSGAELKAPDLNMSSKFPLFQSDRFSNSKNVRTYQSVDGERAYIAKNFLHLAFYVWGFEEWQERVDLKKETNFVFNSCPEMASLPIEVQFSNIGLQRFKLSDLCTETTNWVGSFDAGKRIVFRPKVDLGAMTVFNNSTYTTQNHYARRFFQELWPTWGWLGNIARTYSAKDIPETVQKDRSIYTLRMRYESTNLGVPGLLRHFLVTPEDDSFTKAR